MVKIGQMFDILKGGDKHTYRYTGELTILVVFAFEVRKGVKSIN